MSAPGATKKVLHLTLYLDIGGLERMVLLLCRGQKREGWDPSVIVYERDTAELLPQFEREKIPVTFLRKGHGFSPRLPFRILARMRAEGATLLHTHDLGALIYGSLTRLLSLGRIRIVHTQHSFQHLSSAKARFYERIFPWLADRVVCVSEDLRRTYLACGQPFERLRIVPNGVDFDPPRYTPEERAALRRHLLAKHRLPVHLAAKKWVVTLGRLASVKGPHHAATLWSAARATDAELFVVGPEVEPGMRDRIRALAPGAHLPGATLDPSSWLAAADLFLSASEFEGMPLAGLEAAAHGLPMLLSDIPGHSLFREWGAFFPLRDPAAGAALLTKFLREGTLGESTGDRRALERLERAGGARRMTERYLKIYGEL